MAGHVVDTPLNLKFIFSVAMNMVKMFEGSISRFLTHPLSYMRLKCVQIDSRKMFTANDKALNFY